MKRFSAMLALGAALGCSPTVRLQAPQEPITINVNVKLDADVRVKLQDQAHTDIAKNPEIF